VRLLLVRHGLTAWNAERRLQGHTDIPLTDVGRHQVRKLAPVVSNMGYVRSISSDLVRAKESATLLGAPRVETDEGLRERNAGDWTGHVVDELKRSREVDWAGWHGGYSAPDGAENWGEFTQRVTNSIGKLAEKFPGENCLVVCHGGVIRACLSHYLGLPCDNLAPVAHASLTVLGGVEVQGEAKLELYNFHYRNIDFDSPE